MMVYDGFYKCEIETSWINANVNVKSKHFVLTNNIKTEFELYFTPNHFQRIAKQFGDTLFTNLVDRGK